MDAIVRQLQEHAETQRVNRSEMSRACDLGRDTIHRVLNGVGCTTATADAMAEYMGLEWKLVPKEKVVVP